MNIEKFVNDYLKEHRHDVLLNPYNGLIEFAEALRTEALKEAVEGKIHGDIRNQEEKSYQIWAESDFLPLDEKFEIGDKVCVIVLKKDD